MPKGIKLPRVDVVCQNPACGKTFTVKGSDMVRYEGRPTVKRFCNMACFLAVKTKPESERYGVCANPLCGKEFKKSKTGSGHSYRFVQKYCSPACGSARANFKGGFIHAGSGYRIMRDKNRAIPEHRLVMERSLGRELEKHETVHHRDGNRLNNSISNLELWSNRHGKGQRVEDKIAFCKSFLKEYGYTVIGPDEDENDVLNRLTDVSSFIAGAAGLN